MDAFDAYKVYVALKAHFSSNYDYRKYGGKTSTKMDAFLKRKDRYFFAKVGRKYGKETEDFFISNFLASSKGWIGDFNEENYLEWKKRTQALTYNFQSEMEYLTDMVESFDELFDCKNGQHPLLLKQYLSKRVSLESMVILESILGFVRQFDKDIGEEFVWPDKKKLIENYKLLLTFDTTKCKLILRSMVQEKYSV